jgi:SAM-dependent methyltransferase
MGSTSGQVREPLPVYFSPSLYDQRRLWVMSILRRERVSEVLDLGCGDGNLLACLCNPPPWLPGGPATQFSSAHGIPAIRDEPLSFVHAKRLIGLDISSRELAIAVQTTAPEEPSDSPNPWSQEKRRWENLEVTILEGSFVDYNPDMCDIECIVSTEVWVRLASVPVEHDDLKPLAGLSTYPPMYCHTSPQCCLVSMRHVSCS